jgi:hypothetical protein
MKKILLPVLIMTILLAGSCKKDETPDTRGTVTIDNTTTLGSPTYFVYGFLFSEARKVTNRNTPRPDVTVDSDGTSILFMNDNEKNSFYLAGQYNDASSAKSAFDNLTAATIAENQWLGLAIPVVENQVWIYRAGSMSSGNDHYAKMRIISTRTEPGDVKPFAECTFEWVYQSDGTLTFPGK